MVIGVPKHLIVRMEDTFGNCQSDVVKVDWVVRNAYESNLGNKGDSHEARSNFTELDAVRI